MMRWTMFIAIIGWALGATAAYAGITVDGAAGDWSGIEITSTHNDPIGDASSGLDIAQTWFYWDRDLDRLYFSSLPATSFSGTYSPAFARVVIDSMPGGGTVSGMSGADYRIQYSFADGETADSVYFQRYNTGVAGNWETVSPDYLDASGSSSFVEFGLNRSAIDSSDGFVWGMHIDDDGEGTDDFSPDRMNQIGTPEPASMALMGLALAGVGAFRRRRKSA